MTWTDDKPQPLEISDEALHIYRAMRVLKCSCPPWPADRPYWNPPDECPDCVEWARLNRVLAPLVQLPLWEVHCVPPPSGECFIEEPEKERRAAFEHSLVERKDGPS
jgi:hypothetical protein